MENAIAPTRSIEYSLGHLIGDVVGDHWTNSRSNGPTVVGHDWGAALAWLVATFVPERVERLAVVSVGHPKSFSAAGFLQKQLSWYMLWFQFPGVAERELAANDWELFRNWAHGGAARGSDDYMERQIADLSRPGRLSARSQLVPRQHFARHLRGRRSWRQSATGRLSHHGRLERR